MDSPWPAAFARVPDEPWAATPIEELALKYDTVEDHGWYRNLDRTIADLDAWLARDHLVMDYSGGTGILADRLLQECSERGFGILIVDSSPKFLRLALEKLRGHERVAFRLIRYLKEQKRLELPQEVIDPPLRERGLDAVVSTNAIHLYYGLEETLASWVGLLRPGGRVFVQSGNIGLPYMPTGSWIIDETVDAIHRAAIEIVREEDDYASYRDAVDDTDRMASYDALRRKFFLPVRPIDHYLERMEAAGLTIAEVTHLPIEAHVDQWYEFLSAYHEGVLGWVGGSPRIEETPPSDAAIADRLSLIRVAMGRVFGGRPSFRAMWTYVTADYR